MVSVNPELYLQPSLDKLRLSILEHNRPGSLEGLLAHHVLKDDSRTKIDWQVACTPLWIETVFKPTNIDHVSALGFHVWSQQTPQFTSQLTDGLERVRDRDAFLGEHLSLAHSPSRLLGIILGSIALGDTATETLAWCRDVLDKLKERGDTEFDPLMPYLSYRAFGTKAALAPKQNSSLYELALFDWLLRHQMCEAEPSQHQLEQYRQRILFDAATDLRFESAPQAAFIWSSVVATLFHALGKATVQAIDVVAVLENFEPAMKRWRWDGDQLQKPIRWTIAQEREVQDILWLILRSYFSEVVDEEALPKLGHSSYKADFAIGSLKLIIEVKFATCKDDFKKIEKEVQEDCIPYLRDLRYESLIIFIYDDSASVQEHETTRQALMEFPGVVGVVIASRPSQVQPQSTRIPTRKNKPRGI